MTNLPAGLMVSVSGIRGIVGTTLTPEIACTFASALGTHCADGTVIVGRDPRPSGAMLQHAVVAGLLSTGCQVWEVGIVPTPTVGRAVRTLGAAGGIMITASHNPIEWNGLKLFGPDGAILAPSVGETIRQLFVSGPIHRVPAVAVRGATPHPGVGAEHVARVCALVATDVIRAAHFRVVVDANGGAGGYLSQELLTALGCQVTPIACGNDGAFAHPLEPLPEHLVAIGPQVRAAGAHVGFALDPDADRLVVLDERGHCLSEELTLALAVKVRLQQEPGPVVINLSSSRVTDELARQAGCLCQRSKVGEANVVELMRTTNARIGGEGNGGVIDPRVGWVRDPFIGMGLILHLLAHARRPLSALVAELPTYHMTKRKVPLDPSALPALLARLRQVFPTAQVDDRDGLRLDVADGWVQVRASNTEPIVRVIAEATTADRANELADAVTKS
jgi:phosphomannomutase